MSEDSVTPGRPCDICGFENWEKEPERSWVLLANWAFGSTKKGIVGSIMVRDEDDPIDYQPYERDEEGNVISMKGDCYCYPACVDIAFLQASLNIEQL